MQSAGARNCRADTFILLYARFAAVQRHQLRPSHVCAPSQQDYRLHKSTDLSQLPRTTEETGSQAREGRDNRCLYVLAFRLMFTSSRRAIQLEQTRFVRLSGSNKTGLVSITVCLQSTRSPASPTPHVLGRSQSSDVCTYALAEPAASQVPKFVLVCVLSA